MAENSDKITVFWFRRDLRLDDNAGLYHALKSGLPVLPLFIFDKNILDALDDSDDARVTFLHGVISDLRRDLMEVGGTLLVRYGKPVDVYKQLLTGYQIAEVHTNHDYEPYASERDEAVSRLLKDKGVAFKTHKDQVVFERRDVLTGQEKPYTVFTPYRKKWLSQLTDDHLQSYASKRNLMQLFCTPTEVIPSLKDMGFRKSFLSFPGKQLRRTVLENYADLRDYPAEQATTRIGMHLRFGTVSIRAMVKKAQAHSPTWLNELIWREFYMQILANFPHVATQAFRPAYDRVPWRNDENAFEKWCTGETGYPIVDAGMRQMNAIGYMHNRVRMITASFLSKHLLIDWRWGEAYFGRKLLDYELASNNGGWQWAAGSGTDAQPYFRIFNPAAQLKKFDKHYEYVKKWVPEYGTDKYPKPIVQHEEARERVIKTYKAALRK